MPRQQVGHLIGRILGNNLIRSRSLGDALPYLKMFSIILKVADKTSLRELRKYFAGALSRILNRAGKSITGSYLCGPPCRIIPDNWNESDGPRVAFLLHR